MGLWKRELWRLLLLAGTGLLVGWLLSHAWAGLALGLGACLAFHLHQLRRLHRWLTLTPQAEPPATTGLWGDLLDRLYRYQKGQRNTQESRQRTSVAIHLVTHKYGRIERDWSRGRLCQREQVVELLLLDPATSRDDLALDNRDHRVAATEGEDSDLEERSKKFKVSPHRHYFILLKRQKVPSGNSLPARSLK